MCFAQDATHHTCCELGPEVHPYSPSSTSFPNRAAWQAATGARADTHGASQARKYADASGNPIGTAASQAFQAKYGRAPDENDLTPWCTCFGSPRPPPSVCTASPPPRQFALTDRGRPAHRAPIEPPRISMTSCVMEDPAPRRLAYLLVLRV